MEQIQKKKETFLCGAAFLFFILVTAHKLTNAPLWFDETVEYWYSKVMVGTLPFEESANMYQRIISTYQPPLYNVVMYFWLKFSDSEWWFRFFGVFMGLIGMIGLYKTVHKIANGYIAALAVFFSTCVYQLAYYWQECAEYCLMLGSLFWAVYFWFCLIEKPTKKNIVCFTISAVIPVYSQYGAAFPVIAMAVVALVYVITLKDRETLVTILVADVAALLIAALPLYLFFLKRQIVNQQGGEVSLKDVSFVGGIFQDFFYNLRAVFKWNFFSYYSETAVTIFFVIILLVIIITTVLSKNVVVKWFSITNIIAWFLYYIAVKLGVYSYGNFGSRYNLFFIPVWIILIFSVATEFPSVLARYLPQKVEIKALLAGVGICFILCFSYFGWTSKLQNNWRKTEDCRGVVKAWYEAGAEELNTIIYYGADCGFAYYVRQEKQYNESTENNVHYMQWYRDKSEDEYKEYVDSIYEDGWPDELYVVVSHIRDDLNTFLASIVSNGYEREDIYSNNNSYLIRLSKS